MKKWNITCKYFSGTENEFSDSFDINVSDEQFNLLLKNENKEYLSDKETKELNDFMFHITCEIIHDEYGLYLEEMNSKGNKDKIISEGEFSSLINIYF